MLEKLIYKNHLNEQFEFGSNGVFVNESDIHDYVWTASTKGNKISAFKRGIQTRSLPVQIVCDTDQEGLEKKNSLLEIAEKDVLAHEYGSLIVGKYYFKCFITGSAKSSYLSSKKIITAKLTITTDQPVWIREEEFHFKNDEEQQDGHGFPYNYPYNYAAGTANVDLINPAYAASDFRMIIYGSAVNPSVTINNHVYQVNCTVPEGGYLTIDSAAKKIFITASDGSVTNVFANRNRSSYVFEKIKSGESSVSWAGSFAFDIVILEERSEPKWI